MTTTTKTIISLRKNKPQKKSSQRTQSSKSRSGLRNESNVMTAFGIPRFLASAFPPQRTMKLIVCENNAAISGLSGIVGASKTFVPNNARNVFLAAGPGFQPPGFDTLCGATAPYQRFKVMSFKTKITFFDASDAGFVLINARNPTNGNTLTGLTLGVAAAKHTSRVMFMPVIGAGPQVLEYTLSMKMNQLFNWTAAQYAADMSDTTGAYNGDPADLCHVDINFWTATVNNATVHYLVQHEMDVLFYERNMLADA